MSQVISVRVSDADFEAFESQAQNAQLKVGTFVADILHAHVKNKATCASCGDPIVPGLQKILTDLRATAGVIDDLRAFLHGRKLAAEVAKTK